MGLPCRVGARGVDRVEFVGPLMAMDADESVAEPLRPIGAFPRCLMRVAPFLQTGG
jgi:hypothetical protein